jgi:hypothetical protein
MNVIDQILNEWSFRCHDGVVDLDDPKKVKILFEIIRPVLAEDIDDDILNLLTQIDDQDTKSKILKYLSNINKKEDKVEDKIEDNLEKELELKEFNEETTEYISLLASKYNITKELEEYLNSKQLLSLSDLGKEGNLYNIIKTKTDFPDGFIKRMINYTPSEKNKALGIGEIALALFFDAKKQEVGDIEINGKTIELKGTLARFPGEGKGRSGNINDLYDELNKKYPDIILRQKQSSLNNYIRLILEKDPEALDFINTKLNNIYPKTDDIKIDPSQNINSILNKKYIASYVRSHPNNDYYMLISKDSSGYNLYTNDELIKAAEDNNISLSNISKSTSYPQLII